MKWISRKFFVLAVVLTSFNVNAFGEEEACNEDAVFLPWEKGMGGNKEVSEEEILASVDPRFRLLVKNIADLPPKVEEKRIFDIVKTKPSQDIRVRSYTEKLTWYLPEKDPVMALVIFMYKGCVSSIYIIIQEKQFFYSRRSKLSSEP